MLTFKKNELKEIPFQECAKLDKDDLELWAKDSCIAVFGSWVLPQMLAYFATLKVTKTPEGLYDPKALMQNNFSGNDWALGLWKVCTKLKRSALVKTQTNPLFSEYSALTPLILAGFKKFHNIPYEMWDKDGIQYTMDESLYLAATYVPPELDRDTILNIRKQGLTYKSGNNIGTQKNPLSTWKLTGIIHTELGMAPPLATTMLSQIWVAHPSLRSRYMILDPTNWDNMPEPLLDVTVVSTAKPEVPITHSTKLPWE